MSFKILGIKIFGSCEAKYRKVLKKDFLYQFYQNYEVTNIEDTYEIKCLDDRLNNLYRIKHGKDISISAIVGKNGSGKSTLVELLYHAVYNISCIKGILYNEDIEGYLSIEDVKHRIDIDLIFEVESKFYLIRLISDRVILWESENDSWTEKMENKLFFKNFFYTIVMNYSHHALSEDYFGDWIKYIFHKNDAYQTPIVINPFRNNGDIKILGEEYLVKSRFIANILTSGNSNETQQVFNSTLLNNKAIKQFRVTLNKEKLGLNELDEKVKRERRINLETALLMEVYQVFLSDTYYPDMNERDEIKWANKYIISKIETIVGKYPPYFDFKSVFRNYKTTAINELIYKIQKDKSHITFKLRQAINYIRNPFFNKKGDHFNLDITETSGILNDLSKELNTDLIDLIPPSFFNIEIDFGELGTFESFSSGEKQKVFTISTVIYHLININSVNKGNHEHNVYQNVNLIFDEIELYFHPEFQRTYIHDLVDIINKTELDNIKGINCIFITHSPFILSDIPFSNILFLNEKGESIKPYKEQTFGANIYDLLKNSFFLDKGFIGKFAKERINEVIRFIRYRELVQMQNKDQYKNLHNVEKSQIESEKISLLNDTSLMLDNEKYYSSIIDNIGEPVIRIKLKEMYYSTIEKDIQDEIIDNEIKKLQELKNRNK